MKLRSYQMFNDIDSGGSVLMEYVIVTFFVAFFIIGMSRVAFNPSGGEYNFFVLPDSYTASLGNQKYAVDPQTGEVTAANEKNYGMLGDAFVRHVKIMVRVISSPLP